MRFVYGKQDMRSLERAQENCWLVTNGLGGFASLSGAFSVTKADQGLLIAARTAPCERYLLVQRLQEQVVWSAGFDRKTKPVDGETETAVSGETDGKAGTVVSGETDGEVVCCVSTQNFADGRQPEEGFRHISSFVWEDGPVWVYEMGGLMITRRLVMKPEENTTAVLYRIVNGSHRDIVYRVRPGFMCTAKGAVHQEEVPYLLRLDAVSGTAVRDEELQRRLGDTADRQNGVYQTGKVVCEGCEVFVRTNGSLTEIPEVWELLSYRDEARDGRTEQGMCFLCMQAEIRVASGESRELELILSDQAVRESAWEIQQAYDTHMEAIDRAIPFRDPVARQLAVSADAYVTRRDSTDGKTIVAGYPFFGDWGRDTMIALPGCVLAPGQIDTAKSILRTFLEYERDGLVPNLFPEGKEEPRYNTVDAALLLINCVWLYYEKTKDRAFVREAYPVLCSIVDAYRRGTHHAIRMDEDGLIQAGEGLDQVTWMDVCVEGILPTPRHGKPVEINAYWYNALKIMECFAQMMDGEAGDKQAADYAEETKKKQSVNHEESAAQRLGADYAALAERVRDSFLKKFWIEETGYLKDVVSVEMSGVSVQNTPAEKASAAAGMVKESENEQIDAGMQIRCNQIWAVTMPFTMLSEEQERMVVDTVLRELYTPCGLRTLAVSDPQFHPTYGGSQRERDMAYHQGTVWVFPLGAFYRGYLKVHGYSKEAVNWVKEHLEAMLPMLREGCVGQLPEIYDGLIPGQSKGCFAQAWSVGEILSVYELLERCETLNIHETGQRGDK